jgi:hypothetical protein
MFAKTFMLGAVAALTAASMTPAAAEARSWNNGYHQVRHDRDDWRGDRKHWKRWDRGDRWDRGRRYGSGDRYYHGGRRYSGDRYYYGGGRRYYGNRYYGDRRYYGYRGRRCDSGTGGTIVGAIAGGLLGNAVVGRYGDNTTGAIVGAGIGALAGREIDRNC